MEKQHVNDRPKANSIIKQPAPEGERAREAGGREGDTRQTSRMQSGFANVPTPYGLQRFQRFLNQKLESIHISVILEATRNEE